MTKPMTDDEWRDFCSATLHGPPPHKTLMRIYATVDKRAAELHELGFQFDALQKENERLRVEMETAKAGHETIEERVERVVRETVAFCIARADSVAATEFFHDGLQADLDEVEDKAHAFREGFDEATRMFCEQVRDLQPRVILRALTPTKPDAPEGGELDP